MTTRARSAALAFVIGLAGTGAALADCNADIGVLMNKRMGEIDALNKISKAHGGKLDPVAACPRLRSLAAAEGELVAYMTKNKDWCSIPEDFGEKMSATRVKTTALAGKACGFAAKMKDMQAQAQKQAQSQSAPQQVQLPTGPL